MGEKKENPFSDKYKSGVQPPLSQNPNVVVAQDDPPPSYFNPPPPVDRRLGTLQTHHLAQAAGDDPFSTPPIRIPKPPPDPRGPCAVSPPPRRSIEFDPNRSPNIEFEPDRDYSYKPQPRVFGAGDPRIDKGINTDYDTNLKPEYNAYYNTVKPHPNPYDDVPTAEASQRLSIANEENSRDDGHNPPPLPLRPCAEDHPERKKSVVKRGQDKLKSRHEKIKHKLKGSGEKEKMDRNDYADMDEHETRRPRGGVWQKERRDWRTGEPIDDDSIYRHDLHDAGYQDGQPRSRRGSKSRVQQGGCTDCALYFIAIFVPPIPVLMKIGWGCEIIINIVLWICGWVLGVIHAWYIIYTNPGISM
ncbi:hypothetical protein Q8F55_004571 [Vanrija albida]|uniref:Uncharacterized protein n=1 Tax=Vanrija albida TaxID=181172 RepID=A0ABR3Q738_9TREE